MDSDSDYDDIESGLSMDDDSDDSDFDDIESDDSDDSDLDDIVKNNNLHWWKTEETPLLRYAILVLILVPMLALSYNWFYFRVDPDCSFCTLHADLIVSLFLCFRFILYSTILRDV
ncbi:hypothetical protein COLO4_29850 [Corchorus olitorius]|uniref:Uncharacterized protein n=1 Tax=Corchorus olitorius TaxID=93759 RepID=A0A1R3HCX9_9ROSI|nr:hypothetical protein COLO4_29850 [Corchorus olitorius]